jgi:pyruvate dehydrogenase (quinone)
VAKALLGRTVLADDLPYVTGAIGLLGTEPSWKLMMECDTLLMVGTSAFPTRSSCRPEGQARGVQIDIKPRMLGLRYPMEVNLCGDSRETLQALIPYLERKTDRGWRQEIERTSRAGGRWSRARDERRTADQPAARLLGAEPAAPAQRHHHRGLRLRRQLVGAQPEDEGGDDGVALRQPGHDGPGVPYAIAAKFAHPDRPVIACVGDGAMQMNGINGLITIEKLLAAGRTRGSSCWSSTTATSTR